MSTTKLTRKEILGEDPIHDGIVHAIELFRVHSTNIAIVLAGVLLLGIGGYFGLEYLDTRDMEVQTRLSRGMDFYHAQIDATALDDPFGKGPDAVFRTLDARYKTANSEFNFVLARQPSSKLGIAARYYVGLCQKNLGQTDQAIGSLEQVRNNNKDMTLSYLAKKVLAQLYAEKGNFKGALDLLDGMIKDPQCMLPKEELKFTLARIYLAQGKRAEAVKFLREARDDAAQSTLQPMITNELTKIEGNPSAGANVEQFQVPALPLVTPPK